MVSVDDDGNADDVSYICMDLIDDDDDDDDGR